MTDPLALHPSRKAVTVGVVGALVQIVSIAPLPLLVREIFNELTNDGNVSVSRTVMFGAIMMGLRLLTSAATIALISTTAAIAADYAHDLRSHVRDLTLRATLPSVRRQDDAELVYSLAQVPQRIEVGAFTLMGSVVPSALIALAVGIVLFIMDWQMSLVLLAVFPLTLFSQRVFRAGLRLRFRARSRAEQAVTQHAISMVDRLESLRTGPAAAMESARHNEISLAVRDASAAVGHHRSYINASLNTAIMFAITLLLVFGAWAIDRGRISVGEFLAFYAGVALIRGPLGSLGTAVSALDNARDGRRQLRELADSLEFLEHSGTTKTDLAAGLEVTGVSFSFGDQTVFSDVSLKLCRGRTVAIVGENGAGKTTLLHLLLGLYEPASGTRTADGVAYAELDLAHLRDQIGVSFQQAALMEGTVLDNITYGRSFSDEQIAEALHLVGLSRLVGTLPDGLETVVGPGGRRLSRGQEQRIALARAAIGRPPVLVLDEPTNHLDPSAVTDFLSQIAALEHSPAVLLVSHDRRALELADEILELADGELRPLA